jgi:D-serine deaminase-like pyridoxal phosphate-dependent protein
VIDAGSKSLSADRRVLPDGSISLGYVPAVEGQVVRVSEEHGIIAHAQRIPNVGERVTVIPNHVCPVVNLFDEAVVMDEAGSEITRWAVAARGKIH